MSDMAHFLRWYVYKLALMGLFHGIDSAFLQIKDKDKIFPTALEVVDQISSFLR